MANVLMIDDSVAVLEMLQAALEECDHHVVSCLSAGQGIEVLSTGTVDVIITDIYMPARDGLDVIKCAKQICPAIPIIAISGQTGEWNMLRVAKCLGAARTLQKPFSITTLLQTVEAVLSEAGSRCTTPRAENLTSRTNGPNG